MTPHCINSEPSYHELPDRSRRILASVVKQYIEKGEPISSLWLTEHGGFGWSSATVRNVMAKLEELGYVHQPHTSSGRVPTDQGYRSYVDLLLDARKAAMPTPGIEARLRQAGTISDILANVSHELSRASNHLGFALMPPSSGTFRHIEFVPLDNSKILVIVNTNAHKLSQKVIDLGEKVSASELSQGANYLNDEFAGLELWDVRSAVVAKLRQERMLYNKLLSRALRLASLSLEDLVPQNNLFLEGAGLLLDGVSNREANVSFSTLRALLTMIERKDQLVRLLNEYIEGQGLTVVIGTEHVSREMQNFSLVMSTYSDGQRTGSIGVIGPRRMRYSRTISAVDSVSRAVSRVLVDQTTAPPDNDRRQRIGTS
jgi:heat-inducible transcriptional repressor